MKTTVLLDQFKARGVVIEANGDRLKLTAPTGVLTDDDRAELRRLKPELLLLLSGAASGGRTRHAPDVATVPRVFDAGEAYRLARSAGKQTHSEDVPPALAECPDRRFDTRLKLWKSGEFIEYTTGTAPAY